MGTRSTWRAAVLGVVLATWSCDPLEAQELVRDPATEPARAAAVLESGLALIASPNSIPGHIRMARAYYERGALNDALRVNRHLRRAVDLEGSGRLSLDSQMREWRAGLWTRPLSVEMTALDLDVETTLRAGETVRDNAEDHESRIETRLADRMARSRFPTPSLAFTENLEDLNTMYEETADDTARGARLSELAVRGDTPAWQQQLRSRFVDVAQLNNQRRRSEIRLTLPGTDGAESEGEQVVPDPLSIKNEAYVDYVSGDVESALEKLQIAAAAVLTLNQQRAEGLPTPERRMETFATPVREEEPEGTPTRAEPAPPTPDREEPPPPTPERAPARVPPRAPTPSLEQDIGEATLEAAEAIVDPEIPKDVVDGKLDEVAAIGNEGEPLLIDLDGDGIPGLIGSLLPDGQFEDRTAVPFDLDGNGRIERVEWVRPGTDGLLAYDANGNGRIDSGLELFGRTVTSRDGFARLAVFDRDGDGWVRGDETQGLIVWRDDGDGISQRDELESLASHGIDRIRLPGSGSRLRSIAGGRRGVRVVWEWYPEIRDR